MKIYVGCALTGAPKAFIDNIEELKRRLRINGHTIFDFVGLTEGTANDVYKWDIEFCVKECELFLAICDHPSIGLGFELAMALNVYNKRVVAFAHKDTKLTRLVSGIPNSNFEIRRYESFQEIVDYVNSIRL